MGTTVYPVEVNLAPITAAVNSIDADVTAPVATQSTLLTAYSVIDTEVAQKNYRLKSAPATGVRHYPSLGPFLTVTAGTPAYTYGAWVQMLASLAYDSYILSIVPKVYSLATYAVYAVGLGGAGAEVQVAEMGATQAGAHLPAPFSVPIFVPAGTRIACAVAGDTVLDAHAVALGIVRASDLEVF